MTESQETLRTLNPVRGANPPSFYWIKHIREIYLEADPMVFTRPETIQAFNRLYDAIDAFKYGFATYQSHRTERYARGILPSDRYMLANMPYMLLSLQEANALRQRMGDLGSPYTRPPSEVVEELTRLYAALYETVKDTVGNYVIHKNEDIMNTYRMKILKKEIEKTREKRQMLAIKHAEEITQLERKMENMYRELAERERSVITDDEKTGA